MQGLEQTLIIDDDPQHCHDMSVILQFVGIDHLAVSSEMLTDTLLAKSWHACFIGSLSGNTCQNLVLPWLKKRNNLPFVSLSESNKLELNGLPNFIGQLSQPIHYIQLVDAVRHCQNFISQQPKLDENHNLKKTLFRSMVGSSKGIRDVRHLMEQVAKTDANVLILGESGTGKEVVARNIHYHSSRGKCPFVPVNCGSIPADLLESELFGHEKGAFAGAVSTRKGRFELANGGTLFLDEIGDMPISMQVKLLRILKDRTFERVGGTESIQVDVRIVAATHQDIPTLIADKLFREDLYYRLNVFPITMPSLLERVEDIPLLLQELLARMEAEGANRIHLTPRAVGSLMKHTWPGNVRELANLIERLIILYPGQMVDVNHLPLQYRYVDLPDFNQNTTLSLELQERQVLADLFVQSQTVKAESANISSDLPAEGVDLKAMLANLEVEMICQALEAQAGVVARAADMLGMRRTTLVEKMRKYGLNKDENR